MWHIPYPEWSMSKYIMEEEANRLRKRPHDTLYFWMSDFTSLHVILFSQTVWHTYWSQVFKHNNLIGQEIKHIIMCVQRSKSTCALSGKLPFTIINYFQNSGIHFIRGMPIKVSTWHVLIFSNGLMKEMVTGWFDL